MSGKIRVFIEDLKKNETLRTRIEEITTKINYENITKEEFALLFEKSIMPLLSEYGYDITIDEFIRPDEEVVKLDDYELAQVVGGVQSPEKAFCDKLEKNIWGKIKKTYFDLQNLLCKWLIKQS